MRSNAIYKSALIVICLMSFAEAVHAQHSTGMTSAVVKAVAPIYPMITGGTLGPVDRGGDVLVDIQVDNGGVVVSARAINGYPLLQPSAVNAARRWQFAPAAAGAAQLRTVRLRFTYQTMSKDTPESELITTFNMPYHVEVRRWSVETRPAP